MAIQQRLNKAETQLRGRDPSIRMMSRESFDLAVNKFHRGLNRLGFRLTIDQVRRLEWWFRATEPGRAYFGRGKQIALVTGNPSDYCADNFNPEEFQVTETGLEMRC